MIRRSVLLFLIMSLVILSACDNSQQTQNQATSKLQITVENASWLRNKLPEKTLAYIRVPTIWNLFFEGNADSLYPALSHDNNKVEVEKLKYALVDTYLAKVPEAYKIHFKLLVKSMDTPLELAVTNAVDDSMVPNFLMGTTLKDFSKADLQALIDSLVSESKNIVRVLEPVSDDGKATLMAQMMPVHLDYDFASGRLALLVGPTATDIVLMNLLAQKQAHASLNEIMSFENSVDQSGKNHEAWVNVKAIYKQNQAMIPPPQRAMMEQMGMADMDFIWMGTGQHSGKGEFIFHIQMPDAGLRKLLPRVNEGFDVQTAGAPSFALVITLPTVEQITQGYEFVKSLNPDLQSMDSEIQAGLTKVNEYLDIDVADLLRAYGQQIMVVKDDSGLWYAQKIQDKNLNEKIFKVLENKFEGQTQTKTLSGVSIDESTFSMTALMKEFLPEDEDTKELDEIFDGKQKIYTSIENDYFIWAAVPQILADRSNSNNKQSLKAHLQGDLQLNWNQALLAWVTESEYVSRDAYHTYLEVISFIGTIAKSDVDLFNFPSAQDLNLPQKGRFGVSLNSSPDYLSLRISYEHSVLESISGSGGMFAVAVVGVLAAYAIPAYRDYTVRAKVMEKMYSVYEEKQIIAESFYSTGAYPNTEFISENFSQSDDFEYNPKNGQIIIYFNQYDDSSLSGLNITITPIATDDGALVWDCDGTVSREHYENACY